MTGRHFPVSLGKPKKTGQPTTTLFIKLSDTSQVALVANQAQTLKQVRQYVVKNISPRRAKFKLHVPDSELLLSREMDDKTLQDVGLLNRVITVTQLPLKNKAR
jgi:hypothetical protein